MTPRTLLLPPALRNISKPSAGYIYVYMKFKAALSLSSHMQYTYVRTSPSRNRQTDIQYVFTSLLVKVLKCFTRISFKMARSVTNTVGKYPLKTLANGRNKT